MPGEAQGQAGKGCRAACPAMSSPESSWQGQTPEHALEQELRYNHGYIYI